MIPLRGCFADGETHVVDATGVACGVQRTHALFEQGAAITVSCLRCRKRLGDFRRGSQSWRRLPEGLIHSMEPALRVKTGEMPMARETWRPRCITTDDYPWGIQWSEGGRTNCLACLGMEGES